DEATDRVVGFEQLHRVEQLGPELAVHGVEGLGPVERDDADTVLPLDQDVFVCHRLDPPLAVLALWSRSTVSVLKMNGCVGCQLHLRIVIVEADPSVVAVVAAHRAPSKPEMIAPSPMPLHCSIGSRMRPIPMDL